MIPSQTEVLRQGCRLLGWPTEVAGPVTFGGVVFWASLQLNEREHQRRQAAGVGAQHDRAVLQLELDALGAGSVARVPLAIWGALVVADHAGPAMRKAGLLAGYCRRAVLVPDQGDVLGLMTDAAILDQGVLLHREGELQLLAEAGPCSALQGGLHARAWELAENVYEVFLMRATASA